MIGGIPTLSSLISSPPAFCEAMGHWHIPPPFAALQKQKAAWNKNQTWFQMKLTVREEGLEESRGRQDSQEPTQLPISQMAPSESYPKIISALAKSLSLWGIPWHSCVREINLKILIRATIELLTPFPSLKCEILFRAFQKRLRPFTHTLTKLLKY